MDEIFVTILSMLIAGVFVYLTFKNTCDYTEWYNVKDISEIMYFPVD